MRTSSLPLLPPLAPFLVPDKWPARARPRLPPSPAAVLGLGAVMAPYGILFFALHGYRRWVPPDDPQPPPPPPPAAPAAAARGARQQLASNTRVAPEPKPADGGGGGGGGGDGGKPPPGPQHSSMGLLGGVGAMSMVEMAADAAAALGGAAVSAVTAGLDIPEDLAAEGAPLHGPGASPDGSGLYPQWNTKQVGGGAGRGGGGSVGWGWGGSGSARAWGLLCTDGVNDAACLLPNTPRCLRVLCIQSALTTPSTSLHPHPPPPQRVRALGTLLLRIALYLLTRPLWLALGALVLLALLGGVVMVAWLGVYQWAGRLAYTSLCVAHGWIHVRAGALGMGAGGWGGYMN